MNLQNWVRQAREHWKEHLPKLYRELEASKKLEPSLQDAAERTYIELTDLEDQGYDPQGAWEAVRERYLFPPNPSSLYAIVQRDSPDWSPSPVASATDWAHAAIKSGAREIPVPQPTESKNR